MKEVSLVFPHQLFEDNPSIIKGREVFLLEDELYFRQYPFHKKKILIHRASMKFYEHFLHRKNVHVHYISCFDELHSLENLFIYFKAEGIASVHYCDTADYLLERRLKRYSERNNISLHQSASPCFLNTKESLADFFDQKEKFFLHDFYIKQRKQLDVLLVNNKPTGGQWSFDEMNRKRLPREFPIPEIKIPAHNSFVTEAEKYVSKHFTVTTVTLLFFNIQLHSKMH